jgi:hypothetical protein
VVYESVVDFRHIYNNLPRNRPGRMFLYGLPEDVLAGLARPGPQGLLKSREGPSRPG